MRAIFIDATNRTVEEIDFEGDFRAIQEKIGVRCFDCIELNEQRDTLYVDDEGLLNGTQEFFYVDGKGYCQTFAGNGLVLGTNSEGESTDISGTEKLKITFMDRNEAALRARLGQFS